MSRSGMRSFVLLSVLIMFSLLLASGGPRLIGHTEEYNSELIEVSVPLLSALSQAPQRLAETGIASSCMTLLQRRAAPCVIQEMHPSMKVISDANGNVLRCRNYMHAVYQAFSLGDGFV